MQSTDSSTNGKNTAGPKIADLNAFAQQLSIIHPADLKGVCLLLIPFAHSFMPDSEWVAPYGDSLSQVEELALTVLAVVNNRDVFPDVLQIYGELLDKLIEAFTKIDYEADTASDQERSDGAHRVTEELERIEACLGCHGNAPAYLNPIATYRQELEEGRAG